MRSLKKGIFFKAKKDLRNLLILPSFVGRSIKVYNGNKFFILDITESMIGHKIGDFVHTRKRPSFK